MCIHIHTPTCTHTHTIYTHISCNTISDKNTFLKKDLSHMEYLQIKLLFTLQINSFSEFDRSK